MTINMLKFLIKTVNITFKQMGNFNRWMETKTETKEVPDIKITSEEVY